ncbi:sulfatase [Microbacterium sp. YY-01]|uniref:sulfatase n=1 Tax=Microbacterium sp. YY-01 TaxID=3421634 RepID=UPI003D1869BA
MKAIVVMFDTLNRRMLPPYGAEGIVAPNFERLAQRSVIFDNCYGGSMPCMPARRELHTGRYNFLHRSWGPLEPFDDSIPEMLGEAGVHTHLSTDHAHYWEDGGATYHTRFTTFELFRGQEGDPWKGQVRDPEIPDSVPSLNRALKADLWRQDWINRTHMQEKSQHSQTLTFDAGIEFIDTNAAEDGWFVQIETFDPHEPFFSYPEHKRHYDTGYQGPRFDWPDYSRVVEDDDVVEHGRAEYKALLTMCDESLGRVLDAMDEHDLWKDTMLIVCTDHGLLLGEHGWWGKMVQPWYDETIHTPLFVWDPRTRLRDERRGALVQTIDLGPTLLDFFGVAPTADMQGRSVAPVLESDTPVRDYALFGTFGGHACITDGRYVYMRSSATPQNQPLYEYTLMPTRMRGFFSTQDLANVTLAEPFSFTKGLHTLQTPGSTYFNPYSFGTLLYDLEHDPHQRDPLIDDELELRMATALRDLLRATDVPLSQFERLGLPSEGALTSEHLLIRDQWTQVEQSRQPAVKPGDFGELGEVLAVPVSELMAEDAHKSVLLAHLPMLSDPQYQSFVGALTLLQIAAIANGMISRPQLSALAEALTQSK